MPDKQESLLVYVNDECTSCGWGDLNLGVGGEGRVPVEWKAVPCPVTTPIQYMFQVGKRAAAAAAAAAVGRWSDHLEEAAR
jgi:expansin (peptidoglycan-binding protein)